MEIRPPGDAVAKAGRVRRPLAGRAILDSAPGEPQSVSHDGRQSFGDHPSAFRVGMQSIRLLHPRIGQNPLEEIGGDGDAGDFS
jgi:hypothetical protein